MGVGVGGRSHLFDLAADRRFELAAVCASHQDSADEAAAMFGAPAAFTDAAAMLRGVPLDAVVVATPPAATPAVLGQCAAAGLPTLVDKPAAADAASLDRLIAALGPRCDRFTVAYNRRYQRHVGYARDRVTAEPGAVEEVVCEWSAPFAARYAAGADTYRTACGFGDGVILDTATHIFDTLAFLGLSDLRVQRARLWPGPTGADVRSHLLLRHARTHVEVRIRDGGESDVWKLTLRARWGSLVLTADGLTGSVDGHRVSIDGTYDHRPVEDLLPGRSRRRGATLAEAAAALRLVDQARGEAELSRVWRRPRAKALGRLNGSC